MREPEHGQQNADGRESDPAQIIDERPEKAVLPDARADNPLGRENEKKLLFRFALPSIVALLVSALYNIVDQFFIGNSVGMLGNAATNVAFPLVTICVSIGLLCGIGSAANFNLAMGRGETERAKRFAGNALSLMLALGLLLFILTQVFLRPLLVAFGATPQIIIYAETYAGITSYGFPLVILVIGGSTLVRADGSPVFSMVCTLVGCVLNAVLDPIFIFAMNMGIAGAALATDIGQAVSAVMVVYYMTRFKTVRLEWRHLLPHPDFYGPIFKLGLSPAINQLAILVVQVTLNNLYVYYGSRSVYGANAPLAAVGIIMKVNMIFFSINIGIAQGLQPIVSYNYGARQYGRVIKAYRYAFIASLAVSFLAFALFQFFPQQIISAFGKGSPEYFYFAVRFFRIFLFFTFINGIQPITMTMFTSIGKAQKGIFISLSRQILFLIPLAFILSALLGIDGILFSAPIADFLAAVVTIVLLRNELRDMREKQALCSGVRP